MSEKITLEAVLPIAAQVFNALPRNAMPTIGLGKNDFDTANQYAELFAEFVLTVHRKINGDTENTL